LLFLNPSKAGEGTSSILLISLETEDLGAKLAGKYMSWVVSFW